MRTFLLPSYFVSFDMCIHWSFALILLTETSVYITDLEEKVEALGDEICGLKAQQDKQGNHAGIFSLIALLSFLL